MRLGVLRQHQLGCLEQRDGFHLVGAALRRRIVGAEGGDPPLLVVDPDSGIAAGRRREDVDHGAAHRHLAGLVRAVVEDVAQALQPGAQRVRVERIAGPQRDAGVRRAGEALGRRFDGQDEEAGACRLRRQPRNHRHARAHGRAGGRDAVVGQAIPGGQQQRFHLRPPERGGGGVQPGGAGFAAGDEDQPVAFRRRGLFEKTGGEEGFGFGLHGRATTLPRLGTLHGRQGAALFSGRASSLSSRGTGLTSRIASAMRGGPALRGARARARTERSAACCC